MIKIKMTETAKFSVSGEEFIDDLIEENKKLKEILNRIKELYEDEDEAELLNYLDEILDEI